MFSLKYLTLGFLISLACVAATIVTTSSFAPPPPAEPSVTLLVLAIALCFSFPTFITSLLLRGRGAVHDLILGVVLVGLLFAAHFGTEPWFVALFLCLFSVLGGWLGRRFHRASAT